MSLQRQAATAAASRNPHPQVSVGQVGQVGRVGRVGRRWALSDKSDVQPIPPSAAPLPAPGTDGCPIGGVGRYRAV